MVGRDMEIYAYSKPVGLNLCEPEARKIRFLWDEGPVPANLVLNMYRVITKEMTNQTCVA
jgi:hypothetical protein